MKQSIGVVLFAALVCLIAQPGFAADFVLKMAGIQAKKLPDDIQKVRTYCSLNYRKADGSTGKISKESAFPVTQTSEGRAVLTGPFELVFENVPERESVFGYDCMLYVYKTSNGWTTPAVCNQTNPATTSPTGITCIDASQYFKNYIIVNHL
ncbi:MAG: hypothetical protein FIA89_08430 [Geobacter sp.]|nr:hypothetical protein [Geobacter sp.]